MHEREALACGGQLWFTTQTLAWQSATVTFLSAAQPLPVQPHFEYGASLEHFDEQYVYGA